MTRRDFLRTSLGLAVAGLVLRFRPEPPPIPQPVDWWPPSRMTTCYNQEYIDALEKILADHPDAIDRIAEQFRA